MHVHCVPRVLRRPIRALAAGLAFAALAGYGQDPAATTNDEQLVETLLLTTAQSFRDKDTAAVERNFAENCAGPSRIPKLARATLEQAMAAAQSVSADIKITETHVQGARALVIADIALAFEFGGGTRKVEGPYLFWLDKGPQGWLITAAEPMATDWTIPEGSLEVQWPEDGVRFAAPKGWGAFTMAGTEIRRAVSFVSPDLSGTINVAIIPLPVPAQLKTIAAQSQSVAAIYPGSRFIDQSDTTLAGQAAIATHMDLALGPAPSRVESVMAIYGDRLLVLTQGIMPATAAPRFVDEFALVRKSLKVDPAVAASTAPPPGDPKAFTSQRFGLGFPVPDGWQKQELDEATAGKRGWAFGVHLRPATGESYILIGGRELPKPVGLKALQDAEMKTLATVVGAVAPEDVKDLTVSGLPARSWSCTLNLGGARRRREVFITRQNLLLFIVADAIPPADYTTVSAAVDRLLETFWLAAP